VLDRDLPSAARRDVRRRRSRIGTNARDWISCSTPLACEVDHARRGLDMHAIEGDAATLDI
jgi:hypothetical protein